MEEVLICGTGPTGLVLAAELKKRGIEVFLFDKKKGPSEHSKALAIQARTLEVFDKMGIITPFLEKGFPAKEIVLHNKDKKTRLVLEGIDSPYPYVIILPQSDTEKILIDHLKTLNCNVNWGWEFIGFTSDKKALLRHGDKVEERAFSWMIGSDGAHSTVRHALDIPFRGEKLKESFLLADVTFENPTSFQGIQIFFNEKGLMMMVPFLGNKMHRLIFPLQDKIYSENEDFRNWLYKWENPITSTVWVSHFTVQRRIAASFRKGTIFLLGDAAHVHSPAGGQGMNMSVQDAHNLAWKLALVIQKKASEALLDSFEKERRPLAKRVLRGTTIATNIVWFIQKTKVFALFSLLLFFLKRKSIRRHLAQIVSETKIRYGNCGERAPDVVLEDKKHLFDFFRTTKFILLIFEDNPELRELNSDLIELLVIKDSKVTKRYKAEKESGFLIRPDGYIANYWKECKKEGVESALEALLRPLKA